jgi:hypothetical protein
MKIAVSIVLLLAYSDAAAGGGKKNLKRFLSPDKTLVASILSIQSGAGTESKIELRTSSGTPVGGKSFMSKDHAHGFGVMKAAWTLDSRFFIFSTIGSGGHEAGHFPTFYYSRDDNKIHFLEPIVGGQIADPDFEIGYPDSVSILVANSVTTGRGQTAIPRTVALGGPEAK